MSNARPAPRPVALVVDDNALIRMDAADILEDAGFIPLEAEHGDAALAVLLVNHLDVQLLFTDVQMPNGSRDGFSLARHTATHWPHIAIVVASGEAKPKPGDLPEGATFINKPFSATIVHERLRQLLSNHQMPKALKDHTPPEA